MRNITAQCRILYHREDSSSSVGDANRLPSRRMLCPSDRLHFPSCLYRLYEPSLRFDTLYYFVFTPFIYTSKTISGPALYLIYHFYHRGPESSDACCPAYRHAASIIWRAILTGSGNAGNALRGNQLASSISDGSGSMIPPA